MAGGFQEVARTTSFERDVRRLAPDIQREVMLAIEDLAKDPIPASRRFHALSGTRPKVYTMDVTGNKAYKMSMEIEGSKVILRRVGTHKQIDRSSAT